MEWVQSLVTVVGILVAALVAVHVSAKQHNRQVLHQTKKDVADALVTFEEIQQIFFEVKTTAELAAEDPAMEDHAGQELKTAVNSLRTPIQQLASHIQLLELTAPKLISHHARNLLIEVREFNTLMMTSFGAYVRADIKQRQGTPEPLRRLTTQAEYDDKYSSVEAAGILLQMATKDFEIITSVRYRVKNFFVVRMLRLKLRWEKKRRKAPIISEPSA